MLLLSLAASAVAQNGYEFQRAIQHRRDFERELDSYRARPNTPVGPGSRSQGLPAADIQEWLDRRKNAQAALLAELAAAREKEAAAKRRLIEANRTREQAVAYAIESWHTQGFMGYDAVALAAGTVARVDGSFAWPESKRLAANELSAMLRSFRSALEHGGYDESAARARAVASLAPATAGRCFEELAERFPPRRKVALEFAARYYDEAHRDQARWSAASTAERREILARWAQSAAGTDELSVRERFAAAFLSGSPSELFASYHRQSLAWLEQAREDRWLRITPHHAGASLTALDLKAIRETQEFDHMLVRFHLLCDDLAAAAQACVRLLDRRGWPGTDDDRAAVDAFFAARPSAVARLGKREMAILQDIAKRLTAPALVRRFVLDDPALPPEAKAASLEEAARLAKDGSLAFEALLLYKGPVWEDFFDGEGLLRVANWALNEPALRSPGQGANQARIDALGFTLVRENTPAALAAVRQLATECDEGAYADNPTGSGRSAFIEVEDLGTDLVRRIHT